MKTNFTNKLKIAAFSIAMLAAGTANAQTTLSTSTNTTQAEADGETIRLIDNKGTIKYLQSNNGITTITSTVAGNRTTTTWQLGGALTDDTYIDATGQVFALDGIKSVDTATESAAGTIVDQSVHSATPANTGYALLVRDEATGETKKLLVSDLIESGENEYEITAAEEGTATFDLAATIPFAAIDKNVQVFRNGAKLRGRGGDYTLATAAGVTTITLVPRTTPASQEWELYTGDIIEWYYTK